MFCCFLFMPDPSAIPERSRSWSPSQIKRGTQPCVLAPDPLPSAVLPLTKVMICIEVHFTGVRETTAASAKGLINQLLEIIKGWDSSLPVFF